MKGYLVVMLLCSYALACGQNLVRNPSFENYSSCPIGWAQLANANYWTPMIHTPDYYNRHLQYDKRWPCGQPGQGRSRPRIGGGRCLRKGQLPD